uniref:RNase H type-1 domain-containing protein n=1 Tax=Fagus sylvatica TaxID=28930 RepID=A0A2N9HDI6_FAGSY
MMVFSGNIGWIICEVGLRVFVGFEGIGLGVFVGSKGCGNTCVFPKVKVGLGFRKSKKFNEAFLAKLTWMVTSRRDSICMQALRSKYKVRDDWLSTEPMLNASPTWKAIEKLKGSIAKGSDILPTNKNFAQRTGSGCPSYPLCHSEEESTIHLFFHCNVAKAIWFVQGMNIHSECLPLQSTVDIVNLVLDPPLELTDAAHWKEISHTFAIRFILTLECIWSLRNKVVHKEPQFNISTIIHSLELRIIEHYEDQVTTCRNSASPIMRWTTPPAGHIKLNTDATMRANSSSIAVVARNSVGGFCITWAKHLSVSDPKCTEAAAILWALQLALLENYSKVVVESDSKVCIDAIIGSPSEVNWKIAAIIANVISLSLNFVSVCFVWVKRSANGTAHELAKFSFPLDSEFRL